MQKYKNFYPNSAYFIVCLIITVVFDLVLAVWSIIAFIPVPKSPFNGLLLVMPITLCIVITFCIVRMINLKFIFYKNYFIIPNGAHGEKLKKAQRIVYYSKVTDVELGSILFIPHLMIYCGKKTVAVNLILFSGKRMRNIVAFINAQRVKTNTVKDEKK